MLHVAASLLGLALLGPVDPVSSPEPPAEVVAERTVSFAPGRAVPLNLELGSVRLRRVTFEIVDEEEEEASILGVLRGEDAGTSSNLRARIEVEGEPPEPWVADVRIELLDRRGRRIDRYGHGEALESGIEELLVERFILAYVLPFVRTVRIHVEARPEG